MGITAVSLSDQAAMERWYGPMDATQRADWPAEPGWALHEVAARMREARDAASLLASLEDGGVTMASMSLRLPQLDNGHLAELSLAVHPAHRRRGAGRALLAHAENLARDHGRTTVVVSTETAVGSGEAEARARFARRHGYEAAKVEIRKTLKLPLAAGFLDGVGATLRAPERPADGYDVVTWTGPCPDRYLPGRVAVARAMSTDAPQGGLELGEERWDAARLRDFERTVDAMGRDVFAAAAIDDAGELVGYTELGVPRASAAVAYQFDTLVLPAHRGHGLGLRLKVANLRRLRELSPSTAMVVTWNAGTNVFMNRVNEALGFVDTGLETVWQKMLR